MTHTKPRRHEARRASAFSGTSPRRTPGSMCWGLTRRREGRQDAKARRCFLGPCASALNQSGSFRPSGPVARSAPSPAFKRGKRTSHEATKARRVKATQAGLVMERHPGARRGPYVGVSREDAKARRYSLRPCASALNQSGSFRPSGPVARSAPSPAFKRGKRTSHDATKATGGGLILEGPCATHATQRKRSRTI